MVLQRSGLRRSNGRPRHSNENEGLTEEIAARGRRAAVALDEDQKNRAGGVASRGRRAFDDARPDVDRAPCPGSSGRESRPFPARTTMPCSGAPSRAGAEIEGELRLTRKPRRWCAR